MRTELSAVSSILGNVVSPLPIFVFEGQFAGLRIYLLNYVFACSVAMAGESRSSEQISWSRLNNRHWWPCVTVDFGNPISFNKACPRAAHEKGPGCPVVADGARLGADQAADNQTGREAGRIVGRRLRPDRPYREGRTGLLAEMRKLAGAGCSTGGGSGSAAICGRAGSTPERRIRMVL
ncbi:hypothetical protein H8A92_11875 [Bradyrhizobium sp. 10BB]|nr:hypothetical protein [Bradyrhizobium acaciae]